jgi:hypothetical protein
VRCVVSFRTTPALRAFPSFKGRGNSNPHRPVEINGQHGTQPVFPVFLAFASWTAAPDREALASPRTGMDLRIFYKMPRSKEKAMPFHHLASAQKNPRGFLITNDCMKRIWACFWAKRIRSNDNSSVFDQKRFAQKHSRLFLITNNCIKSTRVCFSGKAIRSKDIALVFEQKRLAQKQSQVFFSRIECIKSNRLCF